MDLFDDSGVFDLPDDSGVDASNLSEMEEDEEGDADDFGELLVETEGDESVEAELKLQTAEVNAAYKQMLSAKGEAPAALDACAQDGVLPRVELDHILRPFDAVRSEIDVYMPHLRIFDDFGNLITLSDDRNSYSTLFKMLLYSYMKHYNNGAFSNTALGQFQNMLLRKFGWLTTKQPEGSLSAKRAQAINSISKSTASTNYTNYAGDLQLRLDALADLRFGEDPLRSTTGLAARTPTCRCATGRSPSSAEPRTSSRSTTTCPTRTSTLCPPTPLSAPLPPTHSPAASGRTTP
jgi:hypothetical protein